MKAILLILSILILATTVEARKIKTKHSLPKHSEKSINAERTEQTDSIISVSTDSLTFVEKILPGIRFYGFDKTVGSSLESFFIVNGLDTDIAAMEVSITYFDMKGRQLHKRNVNIEKEIPAHETVRTDIKSWDSQKSFYFHQSVKPKRQATPFSVKLDLLSIKTGK